MTVVADKSNIEAEANKEVITPSKGPIIGMRHLQTFMMFMLLAVGYSMRVNLSVAIVAMINKQKNNNPDVPVYPNLEENKNIILSSFFMGYITLQVLAGELGKRYGVKWFLVIAMGVNSAGCMLTQIMVHRFGAGGLIAIRVFQGMFQGFFFPSVHNILGKWAPKEERSTLANFVFTGVALGTIFAIPITGIIAGSKSGWPLSFQVFGGIGLGWCVLWAILGSNNPSENRYISKEEQFYIESSLEEVHGQAPPPTPWKAIFTSMPVWAIVIANCGQNWGYSVLLTEIPTYLSKIAGENITEGSYLSAAPYLALFILGLIFGPLSDWIIGRGYLSAGNTRKVMNSIGSVGPAIALVVLGFLPSDNTVAIEAMLITAVGINAAIWCGFQVNHVDLSPRFSGILMGIGNGSSNIFSIISPLMVTFIDETESSQWRVIFIVAAGVYVASDIFYLIYAQAERQWWDHVGEEQSIGNDSTSTILAVDDEKK